MEKLHSLGVVHRDLKVTLYLISQPISCLLRKDLLNSLILELHMRLIHFLRNKLQLKLSKLRRSVKKTKKNKKAGQRVFKLHRQEDQHLLGLLGFSCFI